MGTKAVLKAVLSKIPKQVPQAVPRKVPSEYQREYHSKGEVHRDATVSVHWIMPMGHQVLLVEGPDEIGTLLIEERSEEQIGSVDHIGHERLHLLIAEAREF